jgi:hypothetical protein
MWSSCFIAPTAAAWMGAFFCCLFFVPVALFEKILQDEKNVVTWETRYCFLLLNLPNMP